MNLFSSLTSSFSRGESIRPKLEVSIKKDPKNDSPALLALCKGLAAREVTIYTRRSELGGQEFLLEELNGDCYLSGVDTNGKKYWFARIRPVLQDETVKDIALNQDGNSDFLLKMSGREVMIGISPILASE